MGATKYTGDEIKDPLDGNHWAPTPSPGDSVWEWGFGPKNHTGDRLQDVSEPQLSKPTCGGHGTSTQPLLGAVLTAK